MSINFPLILVLGTAFSGLVWLIDYLVLRPKRSAAAELVKSDAEKETALKEPVVVEYSISFFPVLAVVLVLRSFVAEPFQIPTGSMIPTLLVGDFIVVNKFAYGLRLPVLGTKIVDVGMPKNGEVMVFIPPHEDEYFIKRVVGIPGVTKTNRSSSTEKLNPRNSLPHCRQDDPDIRYWKKLLEAPRTVFIVIFITIAHRRNGLFPKANIS
jgi:signal peptidase I